MGHHRWGAGGAGHRAAIVAGSIRLASGVSFLVAPRSAGRLWRNDDDNPRVQLLLRSMGYRDALIGGMLLRSGLRAEAGAAWWFAASAGADMADLAGGIANRGGLDDAEHRVGNGGAALGVLVGVAGAFAVARGRRDGP